MTWTRRFLLARFAPAVLALAVLGAAACSSGDAGDSSGEAGDDSGEYAAEMAEEHEGDRPVAGAARGGAVDSVQTRDVVYATVGGDEVTGYLATPAGASDTVPGLVVIHEWWGLNDNIRTMARKLAGRGYAALAVDLYGGRVATTSDSAMKLVQGVDDEAARANLRQAHAFLDERGARAVGSIGWCFGGGWSLQTALELPEQLDAAVIYYGRLVTEPSELEALAMPVQGHFGAEDNSIGLEQVRAFEEALGEAGVTNEIYVYEGAGHAFANPSGERYVEAAADTAWRRTTRFLAEHLKEESAGSSDMAMEQGRDR